MNLIIDEDQSAFLPGRSIINNGIIALKSSIVSTSAHHNESHMVVKLDMSKAFDQVE